MLDDQPDMAFLHGPSIISRLRSLHRLMHVLKLWCPFEKFMLMPLLGAFGFSRYVVSFLGSFT